MKKQRSPAFIGRVAAHLLPLLVLACISSPARATTRFQTPPGGRLIVLGFDGADARITREMMDAGDLPNLSKLRAQGTFAELGTTMPAESPVSWASLNSGQNPGKTGIPGFIKRDFDSRGTPMPALGHATHEARRTDSFRLHGLESLLAGQSAATNAAIFGGTSFAGFLIVFALLLRIRRGIALGLALLLGAVGAFGAWVSTGYVPREISDVVGNPTETVGFWEVAAKAGVPCVVIDAAMEWDRPDVENLKLLAGLGVPDVRASNGDWFRYTTSDSEFARAPEGRSTSTGGVVFRVDERDGRIDSFVYGPKNFWLIDRARAELEELRTEIQQPGTSDAKVDRLRARIEEITKDVLPRLECSGAFIRSQEGRCSVPLAVERKNGRTSISIGGQSQDVAEGAWSSWFRVTFELNPLIKVKAITRCKLVKAADPFELYLDFLQIDPSDPMYWQPVARPSSFGAELAKQIGAPYETVGWACMTMPFKDREIDPITFLEDIDATHAWRVKMLLAALERDDWRVLVDVESTPDRVQHMMFQFHDREHPLYDSKSAAQRTKYLGQDIALSDAITVTYREMDRLVGLVMERMRPDDTLLICADHGFQSFRRQVNLNNWLAREGYLAVKPIREAIDAEYLLYVDWPRTRAYSVGLGMIFLNRAGREGQGIVSAADAPALMQELKEKLLALEDPLRKKPAVRAVYEMKDIHSGPHVQNEADLMVGFDATWRVSWATTLGNIAVEGKDGAFTPSAVFEDNMHNWSGDHVSVAEDLVRGIFFCSRKVEVPAAGVNLLHIAPTALAVVGVGVPPEYDMPALRFLP